MDNIKFIRDDVQEKKLKQLQEILNVLSVKPKDADIEAARRFFYSLLRAAQEIGEKKKELLEKERMIKEIEKKNPPKPLEIMKPSIMQKILKDTEPPKPFQMPPPAPGIKILKPEFKPVEEPKTEDVIASIKQAYPLTIFKNTKGETIVNTIITVKEGKITYELTEPEIDFRLVRETEKLVQKDFKKDRKIIKDEKFLTKNIKKAFKNLRIDYTEEYKEEIKYYTYKHLLGLGRIDPLIHDPNINTIICDGLNKPVKITLSPGLEVTTNVTYTNKEELEEQIKQLGMRIKNEASENNPVIEGQFYHFKIEATLSMGEAESKFVIKKMP